MSGSRRAVLLLPPIALLVIVFDKAFHYPFPNWPSPTISYLLPLFRKPGHCLIAIAGLIAPLPLCLAATFRFRTRPDDGEMDTVGILLRQLGVIVAVQVSLFFGLVALGRATTWAFLSAQLGVALLGLVALRRLNDREAPSQHDQTRPRQILHVYFFIIATLALCGVASVHFGQDVGYDIHNYHYYNAHALLHHRDAVDFAVADLNTYFNPMLDVGYYLVIQSVRPVWVGFIVGAVHGVAVVLLYGIALEILGRSGTLRSLRTPLAAACVFAGVCEPMFLSELGTSFHDVLLASFVLAALLLIIRLVCRQPEAPTRQAVAVSVLSGVLVGIAIGFKLTNATYAVGLAVTLLAAPTGWKRRLGLTAYFGAAVLPGFLISNGYWMAYLYAHYGNPLFPFYNKLFKSPYWGDMNITFQHMSLGFRWFDHIFVPFYMVKSSAILSEAPSRDTRLAIAFVLVLLVALRRLVAVVRSRFAGARPAASLLEPGAMLLVGFAFVSYLVWYKQFRVLRYLVAVKMLIPLVCVLLLLELLRTRRKVWVGSTILLALIASQIDVPNFGRRDWRKTFFDFQGAKTVAGENAIVLLISTMEWPRLGQGIGALATELPQQMRFIKIDSPQIANLWLDKPLANKPLAMEEQVLRLVREHQGPIYLLSHSDPKERAYQRMLLAKYDLAVVEDQSKKIAGWCADLSYWRLARRGDGSGRETPVTAAAGERVRR